MLSLGPVGISVRLVLGREGPPCALQTCSSIPDLSPLDATPKCPQIQPYVPWGANLSRVENHWFKGGRGSRRLALAGTGWLRHPG